MKESISIEFDGKSYSILAVQKACYRFTNIASFDVRVKEGNVLLVEVSYLKGVSPDVCGNLEQRLRNEVLDQQLREVIRAQTEGVRNLILAHAFSKTGLIAVDGVLPSV
ncbi:His-Xaa-Ser system protein HxsD [Pigmentiphaga sp. YJ18]|uniref:His-Xaa-Ser system protein HxsD n=1 Tax=Pigmentiphaga sp. YJ18 TaxID=3134907 RepID=UPI00310D161B